MSALTATITMTSLELVEFINSQRKEGEAELTHANFLAKVQKVLGETSHSFECDLPDAYGRPRRGYRFPKREACLMAMSYSYELQAKVFDRMTELEGAQAPAIPNFADPVAAARAWADAKEAEQVAMLAYEAAKPKVEFVDKFVQASTGSRGFREVCKLLKVNEAEFRCFVVDRRIMYRLAGRLTAHQNHIDAGRFEVKAGVADNDHAYTTAKFTAKSVEWIAGEWAKHKVGTALLEAA